MFGMRKIPSEANSEKSQFDLEDLNKLRKKISENKNTIEDAAKKRQQLQTQIEELDRITTEKSAESKDIEKAFGKTAEIRLNFIDKKELPKLTNPYTVLTPSDESIVSESTVIKAMPVIPDDFPAQDKANINYLVNLLFILKLKFGINLGSQYCILHNEEIRLDIYFPRHFQSEGQIAAIDYFKEQGCTTCQGGIRDQLCIFVPIEKVEKMFQDLKSRSCSVTEEQRRSFKV